LPSYRPFVRHETLEIFFYVFSFWRIPPLTDNRASFMALGVVKCLRPVGDLYEGRVSKV